MHIKAWQNAQPRRRIILGLKANAMTMIGRLIARGLDDELGQAL
jgi:hypothetical protein